ncbi:MAG TPA: carboxypeptidase regulatory-like domain-containing protein, partial [Abditibacteriaceae bacterium]
MKLNRRCAFSVVWGVVLAMVPAWAETISVKVVGPDAAPINNAQVNLLSLRGDEQQQGVTDAAGKASFELSAAPALAKLTARVAVHAPGYAVNGVTLVAGKKERTISLEKGKSVSGVVTDAGGKPVAGANVQLRYVMGKNFVWLQSLPIQTTYSASTDANGEWTLHDIPTTGTAQFELNDPAYVRVTCELSLNPGSVAPPLIARPGANLTGRAVDEAGRPVAGIRISAQGQNGSYGWAESTTDADGRYKLTGLGSGAYNVTPDQKEDSALTAAAIEGAKAREGHTVALADLVLTPGALIQGTVVDDESGEPIPGIHIGAHGPHRPRSSAAVDVAYTGADGKYSMRVPPGKNFPYVMGINSEHLYPENSSPSKLMEIELAKGETKTLNFRLKRALVLSGTAIDEAGRPVADAQIMAGSDWRHSVKTDAAGAWRIPGLEPGTVDLQVSDGWQLPQPVQAQLPAKGPITLRLRKIPAVRLQGVVVNVEGAPVTGATVELFAAGRPSFEAEQVTVTDAEGRFVFENIHINLAPTIEVKKTGYRFVSGGEVKRETQTTAVSGAMVPNLTAPFLANTVVLAALSQTATGRVVNPDGKPVAGARVAIAGTDKNITTDTEGKFTLSGLPEGDLVLLAAAESGFVRTRVSPARNTTNSVVLPDLVLAPVKTPQSDVARAVQILQRVKQDAMGTTFLSDGELHLTIAAYDPHAALELAADR